MNEIIVEETGLPLRFPDPRAEAAARAEEFRRLSPDERFRSLMGLIEFGMDFIRNSKQREVVEQLFLKREAEWQRIQRELFAMESETDILPGALPDATLALCAALHQFHVRYAVIGGIAAGYRTHPRFTRDLDVLLTVPQIVLPQLLDDLTTRGFEFDTLPTIQEWTQHHMAVFSFHGIRVDWLKAIIPIYLHVLDRATEEVWRGQPIRVASAEGLILLKLLAFRLQDQVDIQNLIAAQRGRLDVDWIRAEWATGASLDDPRMRSFMESVAQFGASGIV